MVKAFVQLLEGANEIKYQCDFIVYLFFEVTISETEVYDVESYLFFEVTIPETEVHDVESYLFSEVTISET